MEYALALLALSLLAHPLGVAEYEMEPILIDGEVVCCSVKIYNTKDIGSLAIDFKKTGDDYLVSVRQGDVSSSTPAQIQAQTIKDAITIIPKVPQ